jgi:hypothetical protein
VLSEYVSHPVIYVYWRLLGDNGLTQIENNNYSCLNRFTSCDDKLHPLGKCVINTKLTKNNVIFYNPHIVINNSQPISLPNYIIPSKHEVF